MPSPQPPFILKKFIFLYYTQKLAGRGEKWKENSYFEEFYGEMFALQNQRTNENPAFILVHPYLFKFRRIKI
jgi:hypothetical protein